MRVAKSDDVPGLVTEAATLEEIISKLKVLIPNCSMPTGLRRRMATKLRLASSPGIALTVMRRDRDYAPGLKKSL